MCAYVCERVRERGRERKNLILVTEDVTTPGTAHVLGLLEGTSLLPRRVAPACWRHAGFLACLVVLVGGATSVPKVR